MDTVTQSFRRVENGRLVYYRRRADSEFWDQHWDSLINPAFYVGWVDGALKGLESIFTKYLPRGERILEAGCGPGQYVLALRKRGYDAEGIDWGDATIKRVLQLFPELPIRKADVCAIDVPDNFYGGYISLGVIEHRREGPEPFLAEAYRVLRPSGFAIFSVPWFNPVRRLKALTGSFRPSLEPGGDFYQYAFRGRELIRVLKLTGFKIIETRSSDNIKDGLEDEWPLLPRIYQKGLPGRIVKRLVRRGGVATRFCGHTRIYVCRKA